MATTSNVHTERVFEDELCAQMKSNGWAIKTHLKDASSYSRERTGPGVTTGGEHKR